MTKCALFILKVPGDSENEGKLTWTNLKRVVWHESFLKMLNSIIQLSKIGFAYKTFEGILRLLYPIILILSADYEEQFVTLSVLYLILLIIRYIDRCVMALIKGVKSHCPCPICLVPADRLHDHTATYPMRTSIDAIARFELYKKDRQDGEALLQKQSLRPVEVSLVPTLVYYDFLIACICYV